MGKKPAVFNKRNYRSYFSISFMVPTCHVDISNDERMPQVPHCLLLSNELFCHLSPEKKSNKNTLLHYGKLFFPPYNFWRSLDLNQDDSLAPEIPTQ